MMVVISETVISETSSPSIATIRSPGEIFSAITELVRTPETTVPLPSALLTRMIPSFPAGANTVMRVRLAELFDLLPLGRVADRRELPPTLVPEVAFSADPTMASCISSRSKSFATDRDCSDICEI
jgi:hypothetical protein